MIDCVLLPLVAHLICKVDTRAEIARRDLLPPLVGEKEGGLDAGCRLCDAGDRAYGCSGRERDVSAACRPPHVNGTRVHFLHGGYDVPEVLVVSLLLVRPDRERSTLASEDERGVVSAYSESSIDLLCHTDRVVGSILVAERSECISEPSDTETCPAAVETRGADLLPQVALDLLDVLGLRVDGDLVEDAIDALHFQVHQVIHQTLRGEDGAVEPLKIEPGLLSEGIPDKGSQVDDHEPTAVIWTEGDLTALTTCKDQISLVAESLNLLTASSEAESVNIVNSSVVDILIPC
jgi:hypothetical protein